MGGNAKGIEYGWNSTVFTTVENFRAGRDFEIRSLDADESYEKIREQILRVNTMAEEDEFYHYFTNRYE